MSPSSRKTRLVNLVAAAVCMNWGIATADGSLTDDLRISSELLGYDLQYRVYMPDKVGEADSEYPVLYVTDGQSYIARGDMHHLLDRLIDSERIDPVVVVFVDARDPDDQRSNRRNQQFFCNRNYLNFYVDELVPTIERDYPVGKDRDSRTILGLSFGGLNAACFGTYGIETFSGIGMQSPANHPVPGLLPLYEELPLLPLRVFLSTGTRNDNTHANRAFRDILRDKGYPLQYIEVREGHNWNNWEPLLDDVLLYFYGD